MPKFRLLAGKHSGKDSEGRVRIWYVNEVIESDTDLAAKFNAGKGAEKFYKVDDNIPASPGRYLGGAAVMAAQQANAKQASAKQQDQLPHPQQVAQHTVTGTPEGAKTAVKTNITPQLSAQLDSMSIKDLNKVAHEQGLEIKEGTKREDLIKLIKGTV